MGVARFIDLSKCVKITKYWMFLNKSFQVMILIAPFHTGVFQKNVFSIIKSDFF